MFTNNIPVRAETVETRRKRRFRHMNRKIVDFRDLFVVRGV